MRYDEELMDMPTVSPREVTQLMGGLEPRRRWRPSNGFKQKLCDSRPTFRIWLTRDSCCCSGWARSSSLTRTMNLF